MSKTYRKTATIDAEQWGFITPGSEFDKAVCRKHDWSECYHAAKGSIVGQPATCHPHVHTLEGFHEVGPLDWIVKGIRGEFWPIKPDIFEETYEEVTTTDEPDSAVVKP